MLQCLLSAPPHLPPPGATALKLHWLTELSEVSSAEKAESEGIP